jgi:uncharacterized protein YegP (UPF0339 family)
MNLQFKKHPITRQWRWRVKANNGKIIGASSESYWNKSDCIKNAVLMKVALIDTLKTIEV